MWDWVGFDDFMYHQGDLGPILLISSCPHENTFDRSLIERIVLASSILSFNLRLINEIRRPFGPLAIKTFLCPWHCAGWISWCRAVLQFHLIRAPGAVRTGDDHSFGLWFYYAVLYEGF